MEFRKPDAEAWHPLEELRTRGWQGLYGEASSFGTCLEPWSTLGDMHIGSKERAKRTLEEPLVAAKVFATQLQSLAKAWSHLSRLIITGEARYAWLHGIAWRKTDCIEEGASLASTFVRCCMRLMA